MATSYNADWAGDLAGVGAADATKGAVKPTIARRFYDALVLSRQRTAEREIEAYIARHGGVMLHAEVNQPRPREQHHDQHHGRRQPCEVPLRNEPLHRTLPVCPT